MAQLVTRRLLVRSPASPASVEVSLNETPHPVRTALYECSTFTIYHEGKILVFFLLFLDFTVKIDRFARFDLTVGKRDRR